MFSGFSLAFFSSMTSPMEMGVLVVAILVLFGAKSLPGTLRTIGRWMEHLRQVSDEFKQQLIDVESEVKMEFDGEAISTGYARPKVGDDESVAEIPSEEVNDFDQDHGQEMFVDADRVEDPFEGLDKQAPDVKKDSSDA